MKLKLLFTFLSLTQVIAAQTFTEVMDTPFEGVWFSSIAFADVDGDDDKDVLITGRSPSQYIAILYKNDGEGNFNEVIGTPFDGVDQSSIAFSDVDGDNDSDIIISGQNNSPERITKLYTNDGDGFFTEMTGTPFDGIWQGSIALSDVDGDNDQDLLITGETTSAVLVAKLYINDGEGNFTELEDTPFEGVRYGSVAFSDVDGDNDQDVLITGVTPFGGITKLYTNDGTGNFAEMMDTPFDDVWNSSIAFSDVDGDNDQDVLITGVNNSIERIAKLYTNDGEGNFTEMTGTPFEGVRRSSVAFSDVDDDSDQDVLITGDNSSVEHIAKLYINDGEGNFTEMMDTPFDGVNLGSIAISDVDGDNYPEVLITGDNNIDEQIAKLYSNDGVFSSMNNLAIGNQINLKLFPNPSTSSTLFIRCDWPEKDEVFIHVFDVNGRILIQQKKTNVAGQQTIPLDISSLKKGDYFVELGDGKRKGVAKLTIQ